ncbi:Ldh family oxidoreductase [uncultured Gimesia sp.]|uniref:Ldh family oxidoreductase n=1 Tax=uncultured Gimesia sp. TaxID=1678688 RepID=UPI0030D8DFD2|tara:strand:- start:56463 stop:57533 length:1071 start_codon:yes stop_codon:yes gene_type:complete
MSSDHFAPPQDRSQEVLIPLEPLKELLVKLFVRMGMFQVEAEIAADRLIEADLRGIHSHGSRAAERYLDAMDMGDIDPRAQILTITETPAIAVLDGSNAMGHVAATRAMELAIKKASEVGTGTVTVRNSHHFGAAAVYVLLAAKAGMIGYCTTNTGRATVAAHGSTQGATANNAIAWGVPTREGAPFVLDMACAKTSWGKLETLSLYGLPVPPGYALDSEGKETTDSSAVKTLLPAAGPRGYGLAMVSSILTGALTGGKLPIHKTRAPELEGSEHFFYVIDIKQFVEEDKFHETLASATEAIHQLNPVNENQRVQLPGEQEWKQTQRALQEGLYVHRDHANSLKELAERVKYDVPW